jgi:capsule polysaccharide export protein KpsE/RkpR
MAATERIPLLVTAPQKALIARKAKASRLTVNEFVRRAAEVYDPGDNDEALVRLVAQLKQAAQEATAALDAALNTCTESNRRIAELEAAHRARGK